MKPWKLTGREKKFQESIKIGSSRIDYFRFETQTFSKTIQWGDWWLHEINHRDSNETMFALHRGLLGVWRGTKLSKPGIYTVGDNRTNWAQLTMCLEKRVETVLSSLDTPWCVYAGWLSCFPTHSLRLQNQSWSRLFRRRKWASGENQPAPRKLRETRHNGQ